MLHLCISEINNTQVDDAHDIDVVMPMCNFVEYSDIYLKISQLNKIKSKIENGTEGILNLSSNFPHKLSLTNIQISRIRKAFCK